MPKNKVFDSFRPYAAQIIFVDRGKGISAPNLQAAIEEIQERLATIDDHLHQGEGENSVKIGLDSFAFGDSSIALGHGAITSEESERSVSLGADSQAYGASSVAIGDGALAVGAGAVAIGPGAYADADSIIALGNNGHTVIIPGILEVLSWIKGVVLWVGPSDHVIAEIPNPIEAEGENPLSAGRAVKYLTLKNPGRYRIKGVIYLESGSNAALAVWKDEELIAGPVYAYSHTPQRDFSIDFTQEIDMNTTLTFTLDVLPASGATIPPKGGVSQIRICGSPADNGGGVI